MAAAHGNARTKESAQDTHCHEAELNADPAEVSMLLEAGAFAARRGTSIGRLPEHMAEAVGVKSSATCRSEDILHNNGGEGIGDEIKTRV